MQLYQFEKIYSQMEKEFGKIRKGDEETYSMLLLPMESNALKIHRKFPASNSRRMKEAIAYTIPFLCKCQKIHNVMVLSGSVNLCRVLIIQSAYAKIGRASCRERV